MRADDRRAVPHREVHHLADLLREGLRQRAAEHREILREDVDQPTVHATVAGDHAVAQILLLVEAEIGSAVGDEAVDLHEAAGIEQQVEPLARAELALLVLLRDAVGATALFGEGLLVVQLIEEVAGSWHGGVR
jgi:hypothetical protein